MTTQLIGIKEFRENLASYTKASRKKNVRYIVLKKNVPVLEVKAIDEREFALEKIAQEIAVARQEVKQGKVYTQAEVMRLFGL